MARVEVNDDQFNIDPGLRDKLLEYVELKADIINNPRSNLIEYNILLSELKLYVKKHRIPSNHTRCKCDIPTIASYLFNLDSSVYMCMYVFLAPVIITFPKTFVCKCYDRAFMTPMNLAYIMEESEYVWNFDPKRFPRLNISQLSEFGTEEAKSWMQKYKQSMSTGIVLEGKVSKVYDFWLIGGLIGSYHHELSRFFTLTFSEFQYLYEHQIMNAEQMLNLIWSYLFGCKRDYLETLPEYNSIENVKFVFQVLEYLSDKIDFRECLISCDRRTLELTCRFDWIDVYYSKFNSNGSPIMDIQRIMDAGYTKEKFLMICSRSYRNWSPNINHSLIYSRRFRKQVRTMMLVMKRYQRYFQRGVTFMIIQFMAFNDTVETNLLAKDPRYKKYVSKRHLESFEKARYSLQLCPYVTCDIQSVTEMILIEDGKLSRTDTRRDVIRNIANHKCKKVRSRVSVDIWKDIFRYYRVNKSFEGYNLSGCRDIVYDGCKEILGKLLDRDEIIPFDFIEKAKKASSRSQVYQKGRHRGMQKPKTVREEENSGENADEEEQNQGANKRMKEDWGMNKKGRIEFSSSGRWR